MGKEKCVYVLIYKNWQEHYMFTECRGVYSTTEFAEEAVKRLGLANIKLKNFL